tara:strand:+ start:24020 stop:24223 length:204 start_codon:yes stop_codon:yes gene_type:complete
MQDNQKDMDAYIEAGSKLLDIRIAPEHRPGVKQFLLLAQDMAKTLDSAPLDETDSALAPVFRLPDPE